MSCLLRASKESIDWRLRKVIEDSRLANLSRPPIFRVCFPPPLNTHQSPLGLPPTPGKSRPKPGGNNMHTHGTKRRKDSNSRALAATAEAAVSDSSYAVMTRIRVGDRWTWTIWMRFETYAEAVVHARNENLPPRGEGETLLEFVLRFLASQTQNQP